MVEDSVKQLVILGNGFDLACGLNSTYDEFFKERFEKVDTDKIIDTFENCNFKLNTFEN